MTSIEPKLRKALTGISGILVTPFDAQDKVAPARLSPIINRAIGAGVHILVANGNTGEFYGLTTAEAEQMVHSVAEQIAGRVPLLAGVGRSINDACALARASRAAGATALMVHQPPDPFVSPRGVVAYVERVSEAGGGLPLMLEERARFVELIASNILEIGDELLERAVAETGLPRTRIEGERARTVGQLRLFAQVVRSGEWLDVRIDPAMPNRQPLPRPDLRLRNVAIGPVGVFGASNFPLAFSVAGGDTASALAAGCPVVFKAHPAHPGTSELVGLAIQRAAQKTGMPEGVFSMVNGRSTEVGMALVRHPLIKAIGFTGSFFG